MSEVKQVLKGEHSLENVAKMVEQLVTEVVGTAEARAEHLLAEVFTRRFNILAQNTHPALNLEASVVSVEPRAIKILHKGGIVGHWQPEGTDLVRPDSAPAPVVEPEEEEELNQGAPVVEEQPAPVIVPPVVEPAPAPAVVEEPPVDEDKADEDRGEGEQGEGGERDEEEREEQQQ